MKEIVVGIPGVVLCSLVGFVALRSSAYIPLGAITLAIILGIIVGNSLSISDHFKSGINYSEKYLLSIAIALLGVQLNFSILQELGYTTILMIVFTMGVTIFSSLIFAKWCGFDNRFALLLGLGNGICGSSAIAATKDIVGANDEQVGLSIAIVNFLGTIGIFLLPFISHYLLNLSDLNAGVLIGNTLQAVGQVLAAGFSVSQPTGEAATIVKMVRILLLAPVILTLIFVFSRVNMKTNEDIKIAYRIPLFVIGFFSFSLIQTFGLLNQEQVNVVSKMSYYALIVAMSGIGLKIAFDGIVKNGKKALLVASMIFGLQIIMSSGLVLVFLR
tara:strand:+ start:12710 stop:13699 length:990 start_codon:yes stop_codon:yes gene_type:complete